MLIVGTGPGSGAAALAQAQQVYLRSALLRRLRLCAPKIHLRAINEAFAAGNFRREHRRELLWLEHARLKLKPLLQQISTLELQGRALEQHKRIQLHLEARR